MRQRSEPPGDFSFNQLLKTNFLITILLFTFLTSCIPLDITEKESTGPVYATVDTIVLKNGQLKLTGKNFERVTKIAVKENNQTKAELKTIDRSTTQLVLAATNAFSFVAGTAYSLVVSTASADVVLPIQIEITEAIVNPSNLAQEGALNGQILMWDGSKWAPSDFDDNSLSPRVLASDSANSGDALLWNGSYWAPGPVTIDDGTIGYSKITTSGASSGNYLKFDGSSWTPSSIHLDDNSIDLTKLKGTGASTNDVLSWDGSKWVPSTIQVNSTTVVQNINQTVVNSSAAVKPPYIDDGSGNILGYFLSKGIHLDSWSGYNDISGSIQPGYNFEPIFKIITPDNIIMSVSAYSGKIMGGIPYIQFASSDCTGTSYAKKVEAFEINSIIRSSYSNPGGVKFYKVVNLVKQNITINSMIDYRVDSPYEGTCTTDFSSLPSGYININSSDGAYQVESVVVSDFSSIAPLILKTD